MTKRTQNVTNGTLRTATCFSLTGRKNVKKKRPNKKNRE